MRRQLRAAVALCAASAAVSACSDRPTSAPTEPGAPRARPIVAAATLSTLACDFTALKSDARAYAASNKDALFTIIGELQSLSRNGPNAAATDKAFDGLSRLAAIRGTSAQASGVTGGVFDRLTRRFLGCMESYVTAGAEAQDFSGALAPGWAYEVRGKNGVDAEAGAYERGATTFYWAAEAGGASWGQTIAVNAPLGTIATKRALIYGYRLTDFLTNDPKAGSAFEHRTIPSIASGRLVLTPGLEVGLCSVDLTNTLRVQHVATILPKQSLTCAPAPAFASGASSMRFAGVDASALVRRAAGLFAPQPLYAAFIVGSVGGAVSELSPSVVIDMQSVKLAFAFAISDGRNSRPLTGTDAGPVRVRVTTQNGTPLPNVIVTLAVAGNNSVIAYFKDGDAAASATVARTTGTDGVATFTGVSLTKAGGYQLTATGSFDGVAGTAAISNSFNIQNK